ncbi:putative cyanophycinase [Pseudoalteromonas luteoviolacea B = ATCC 29581]|nr:putative cyanophycinase [Pseudoalteromonas luteoviolacea B = ATCC 29581]
MNTKIMPPLALMPFLLFFFNSVSSQELVLIGGALHTCSSYSKKHCQVNTYFNQNAHASRWFQIDKEHLKILSERWPDEAQIPLPLVKTALNQLPQSQSLGYSHFLQLLQEQPSRLDKTLNDELWAILLDTLEVANVNKQGKRNKELVKAMQTKSEGSREIFTFLSQRIKNTKKPSYLAITASSKDPYEAADFYASLLNDYNLQGEWLALTPALAMAISNDTCEHLNEYRKVFTQSNSRDRVYPDLVAQEFSTCKRGIAALKQKIREVDAVFFNGGDQSLTKQVLFDEENNPFPWLEDILSREVLIGTSAGTAIQSGGINVFGPVPMITNGTSLSALEYGAFAKIPPVDTCAEYNRCNAEINNQLTYDQHGGLGSFTLGVLDTHFSERSRTLRLATLLRHSKQKFGFGVDETTALVVSKNSEKTQLEVIGDHGVVILEQQTANTFAYHYLHSGDRAIFANNELETIEFAKQPTSTYIKTTYGEPSLFERNGFKHWTQKSCNQTLETQKLAINERISITAKHTDSTQCVRSGNGVYSISGLVVEITSTLKKSMN